jgi:hypothetical protein
MWSPPASQAVDISCQYLVREARVIDCWKMRLEGKIFKWIVRK